MLHRDVLPPAGRVARLGGAAQPQRRDGSSAAARDVVRPAGDAILERRSGVHVRGVAGLAHPQRHLPMIDTESVDDDIACMTAVV
jgi:hypothetical protein